jgi:DNA gyrase subunit A
MGLEKDDSLLTAFTTPGEGEVILVSAQGQGIRFAEEDVRPMGRPAAGVWGMKLAKNDSLVGGGVLRTWAEVLLVTEEGFGKRIDVDEFPIQGRYGQGVIAMPISKETGEVSAASVVNLSNRVMLIAKNKNSKTVYARSFLKAVRNSKGKNVMAISAKNQLNQLVILDI